MLFIGIKEEDIDRLFESFEQADEEKNRKIEGTGLGLSICKNLVSLMEGSISVTSTYGEGSSFLISIPQRFQETLPEEVLPEDDWTAPPGVRILVVDDMKTNLIVDKGLLSLLSVDADYERISGNCCNPRIGAQGFKGDSDYCHDCGCVCG